MLINTHVYDYLLKDFSIKTSLQYKPYDAHLTCITNFISTDLFNLRTKQYLLTLCEAIKINKRWTTAQHRHNTNTSVTFRSLLSSLTKKEKEK